MAAELCTDAPVHDEGFFFIIISRNPKGCQEQSRYHVNPHQLFSYLFVWRGATLDFCETQDTINQSLIDPNFSKYKK